MQAVRGKFEAIGSTDPRDPADESDAPVERGLVQAKDWGPMTPVEKIVATFKIWTPGRVEFKRDPLAKERHALFIAFYEQ